MSKELRSEHTGPLVSVIVPVYKIEKYLPRCVDSLISQTYRHLEIILVDDGSPDGCPALCDHFQDTDPRVRVIHQVNGGLSFARNRGIKAANGAYLYFLDGDDYLDPDAIRLMVDACEQNGCDLCFCDGRSFADQTDASENLRMPEYGRKKDYGTDTGISMGLSLMQDHAYKPNVALLFIKAGLLRDNNISFYDGIIHEDNLFTPQVYLHSAKCVHVNRRLYQRRIHPDSITTSPFDEKNYHGYYVAATELMKIYDGCSGPAAAFLTRCIKDLCFKLNRGFYQADRGKQSVLREEYESIHQLLKKYRYFDDYKMSCMYRFGNAYELYRKMSRGDRFH